MNQSFPKLHGQQRGARKDNKNLKTTKNWKESGTIFLIKSEGTLFYLAPLFSLLELARPTLAGECFCSPTPPPIAWYYIHIRLNLFFFYIFQDSVLKPTNPLCRPKRSAASPIKIMKSRIWEERWWKASTALWEQGWKWMGGRPQRCYRPISTMGCPTDPRCPTPGSHDIQGPTKAGVQQEKTEDPIASTEDYLCGDWNIKSAYLSFLSFLLISIPGTWQAIIGIKAIIADHQNH